MKQKLILLILSFIAVFACQKSYAQTKFDEGFAAGYKKGYCQDVPNCIAPNPPLAPLPTVDEKSTSYQDGYDRGFKMGQNAQKGNANNSRQRYQTASSAPTIDYMYKPSVIQLAVAKNSYQIFNAIMKKANEYFDREDYGNCIKACEDAMDITKLRSKDCYILMGKSYDKLGKSKQAEKYIKKALKL